MRLYTTSAIVAATSSAMPTAAATTTTISVVVLMPLLEGASSLGAYAHLGGRVRRHHRVGVGVGGTGARVVDLTVVLTGASVVGRSVLVADGGVGVVVTGSVVAR